MKNILVVDDYAVTQRVLSHILRQAGYTTYLAKNGLEALAVLEQDPIDLVICDIDMPEMDGITLLRHLRAEDRYADLPIVMLTASGQDQDRISAVEAGASGFLTKPASSGELLSTVQSFVDEAT